MKLPKLFKTRGYFNFRFIWGKSLLIKLDKEAELIKAFPQIIDFVNENRNKEIFSSVDLHKLKLEVIEIGDGIQLLDEGGE